MTKRLKWRCSMWIRSRHSKPKESKAEVDFAAILKARLLDRQNEPGDGERAIKVLVGILNRQPNQVDVYPILIQILNNRGQDKLSVSWLKNGESDSRKIPS